MDLIVKMPQTHKTKQDVILVFVDRLSKYAYFVACKESLNAQGFAKLFIELVLANHGMPDQVVSDRGPQFCNQFWEQLCQQLGTQRAMSSAYHPETDGQTERMNRVLEDVLRHYVNVRYTDWDRWLPMVQFAVNNSWQESIKATPFFVNYGQHPRTPSMKDVPVSDPDAKLCLKKMHELHDQAKKAMQAAQDRMRATQDARRREVVYKPGDKVLLSTANMKPETGVKKLMPKYIGPFEVKHMVGKAAVHLLLNNGYERLHHTFHTSMVKPWVARPGQEGDVPVSHVPLLWSGGLPVLKIKEILGHRVAPFTQGRGVHKHVVPGKFRLLPITYAGRVPRLSLTSGSLLGLSMQQIP
jgi:hypothetical protein